MGRRRLRGLRDWDDCERCSRCQGTPGRFTPEWPQHVKVVVLCEAWAPVSLTLERPDPLVERLASDLRDSLCLAPDEVMADALVACGLSGEATIDAVAACTERLISATEDGRVPTVVLAMTPRVLGLLRWSGVIDEGGTWAPACPPTQGRPKVLVHDGDAARTVKLVADALGRHVTMDNEAREPLLQRAGALFRALRGHAHRKVREIDGGWTRHAAPLTTRLVKAHLAGNRWVAPASPDRDWRYVVIDIDRHNALQAQKFESTLQQVNRLFGDGFVVNSSPSGGVHVYIRKPRGLPYRHAAEILRAFLFLQGVGWAAAPGHPEVRSQLVEVPDDPPRLPFGRGSRIPGSAEPIEVQLDQFFTFLARDGTSDFDLALARVRGEIQRTRGGKPRERWTPAELGRLHTTLIDAELGLRTSREIPALPDTDPWYPWLRRLPRGVAVVATTGIPAYGTRTTWTLRLVRELRRLVNEAEAQRLMLHWLDARPHNSVDLARSPGAVRQETLEILRAQYVRGVPVRVWNEIVRGIETALYTGKPPTGAIGCGSPTGAAPTDGAVLEVSGSSINPQRPGGAAPEWGPPDLFDWRLPTKRFPREVVLDTAFAIVTRFFTKNVQRRPIPAREFAAFVRPGDVPDMRLLFSFLPGTVGWLVPSGGPERGRAAAKYELAPLLWPALPGEELLFQRP